MDDRPLAIELFAGMFGWGEGLVSAGWRVIGVDILHEPYHGKVPGGCSLILQDVCTLHGAQFKDADLIVGSPPCQEFSYRAMPWKRAKALPPPLLGTNLFWQCWRIQQEANDAVDPQLCPECLGSCTLKWGNNSTFVRDFPCKHCSGTGKIKRYIPLVVENVKGAQPWIGRAKGRYGSFFLWGDVENIGGRLVRSGPVEFGMASVAAVRRVKVDGFNFHQHENGGKGGSFQSAAVAATKNGGGSWFAIANNTKSGHGQNPDGRKVDLVKFAAERYPELLEGQKLPVGHDAFKSNGKPCNKLTDPRYGSSGTKQGGDWFGPGENCSISRRSSSKSSARKAASAQIAKIPFPLSSFIGRVFYPSK